MLLFVWLVGWILFLDTGFAFNLIQDSIILLLCVPDIVADIHYVRYTTVVVLSLCSRSLCRHNIFGQIHHCRVLSLGVASMDEDVCCQVHHCSVLSLGVVGTDAHMYYQIHRCSVLSLGVAGMDTEVYYQIHHCSVLSLGVPDNAATVSDNAAVYWHCV